MALFVEGGDNVVRVYGTLLFLYDAAPTTQQAHLGLPTKTILFRAPTTTAEQSEGRKGKNPSILILYHHHRGHNT